jgi:hypothetical protein
MDRIATSLTEGEREAQHDARATWADLLATTRVAVSPTLDEETRERRAQRARAIGKRS